MEVVVDAAEKGEDEVRVDVCPVNLNMMARVLSMWIDRREEAVIKTYIFNEPHDDVKRHLLWGIK